ncbi:MAG: 6-bladed beta-propeller [Gemmatimonadota bacterium]
MGITSAMQGQVLTRPLGDRPVGGIRVDMVELFRVGSLNGRNDSFGRVMSAAIGPNGRLYVADDRAPGVLVFDSTGRYLRSLARTGQGPGELQQPWLVNADAHDSIYVWERSKALIQVYTPQMRFARSIRVPAFWTVNSVDFLPSGELVIAAFGGADENGIHVLRRDGAVVRTFLPIDRSRNLLGFESSLLGGTLHVDGDELVYSRKSPYDVSFFRNGRLQGRCAGSAALTTRPEDVIEQVAGGAMQLHWSKFTHAVSIVLVGDGLAVNVIMDPANDSRIVDVVSSDCRLIRRTRLAAPVTIVDRMGDRVVAVSNVEFPEVIVYKLILER